MQGILGPTANLGMASPGFTASKSTPAGGSVLILPVKGQKVKGIGPSPLEVLVRSREEEPTRSANRTTVATGLRHDLDA